MRPRPSTTIVFFSLALYAVLITVELDDTADEPDVEDFGQEDDPGRVSETLRRWLAVVRERVAP